MIINKNIAKINIENRFNKQQFIEFHVLNSIRTYLFYVY
jgi:hypothetical protein